MIRKELMALEKEGLFVSHRMGNLLFYKLNKDYPIFHELKSIVFKTIGLEGTLKDALSKVQGIEQAFIYGSFAKGEEHSKSDVDLFMVGSIDENAVIKAIKLVERSTKREVNYTLYTRKEYKHKKRAKDSFIENVLENPIIMLKGKENELR
jgi:predicted nucleotidyltransferase